MDEVEPKNIENVLLTLLVAENIKEKNDCYSDLIAWYLQVEPSFNDNVQAVLINDPSYLTMLVEAINRDVTTTEKLLLAKIANVLSWLLSCVWVYFSTEEKETVPIQSLSESRPQLCEVLMRLDSSIKSVSEYLLAHSTASEENQKDPTVTLTLFMLEKQVVPDLFRPYLGKLVPAVAQIIQNQPLRSELSITQMNTQRSADLLVKKWVMCFKVFNNFYHQFNGDAEGNSIFAHCKVEFCSYLFNAMIQIITQKSNTTISSEGIKSPANRNNNQDNTVSVLQSVSQEDQQLLLRVATQILLGVANKHSPASDSGDTTGGDSNISLEGLVPTALENVAAVCEYIR